MCFASVFIPLTVVATAMRLWARAIKQKRLEVNDYAIIIATVCHMLSHNTEAYNHKGPCHC